MGRPLRVLGDAGVLFRRVVIHGFPFASSRWQSPSPGAVIAGVLRGSPAASSGLSPGDVITAIDGHATASPSSITAAILAKKPGTKVTIGLTDRNGVAHSTIVTLASGPAQ